jgi:hypothetical protein
MKTPKKTLTHITALYYENYGSSINDAFWKPKGHKIFSLYVDAECFIYTQEESIDIVQRMLDKESNDKIKYSYISHEILFNGVTPLDNEYFESEWNKKFKNNQ